MGPLKNSTLLIKLIGIYSVLCIFLGKTFKNKQCTLQFKKANEIRQKQNIPNDNQQQNNKPKASKKAKQQKL